MSTTLKTEKLQHLNSITHEGKVVVLATDGDGKIWYTVKQDGFEESYLNTPEDQRTGWENLQELEFPNETKDQSVSDQEEAELTYQKDPKKFILKSCYNTKGESDVAPVQLVSALGHIYVFRQSKGKTLLVDRFVLDGMTNKLNRKLEVRFKRSKQKHTPTKSMKKGDNGLENVDTLDFRDADGNFFYEPTTELCIVDKLHKGWFSVVLVPTIENDVYRWHIFAYNSGTQKVELTTIRASEEGLFDVKDYTVFDDVNDTLVPRSIPGIIKRTLDIKDVKINNGLAATKYDLQQEQQTKSGEMQLIKTATRLMLAIPTDKGAAALSFAIAGDGTLAQISENPQNEIIRSKQREVLLALNTLDEIKAFGDRTPPPEGKITGLAVGTDEEDAEDLVKISTDGDVGKLEKGDLVKITETKNYQGLYRLTKVDEDTFTIDLSSGNGLGAWEKQEQEAGGLIFDGMITAYEKTADGKLKVICPNHGLNNEQQVQIAGTGDYNDTYPVRQADNNHFVIERKWATGEAINVQRIAQKRRGIVFNGNKDYIAISGDGLKAPSANEDFEVTCSAWIYKSEAGSVEQLIVGQNSRSISLLINQSGKVAFRVLAGTSLEVEDPDALPAAQWVHYAGVVEFNKETQETTLRLCKNGVEVVKQVFPQNVTPVLEETEKLVSSNSQAREDFGSFVAISGDTAIVSTARRDAGGQVGASSADIFQRKADKWEQVEQLIVSDSKADDNFDYSVAISGDTAIVGTYREWDLTSANLAKVGSAYIFQRKADKWEQQTLTANNSQAGDWFGCSVAINGDTAIVGAQGKSTRGEKAGSAYIFRRVAADKWSQVQNITGSSWENSGCFGCSVAISGNMAIIGAHQSTPGEQLKTFMAGDAYIFQRNEAGEWKEVERLIARDSKVGNSFGGSVAISGYTAIVGSYTGAYIFQRNAAGEWKEVEKLIASGSKAGDKMGAYVTKGDRSNSFSPELGDYSGYSVTISGDTAIVGSKAGSAYIFQRNAAGEWKEVKKLIASDSKTGDNFGYSVTISGDTAIVGSKAGSAYIFNLRKEQKHLKFSIGRSFVGKIADVQIWNKARTAEDIKNNMYLQLTGQEVGLVGYWRLGAIVEEKERKVLDFSVNKNHGIVYGEAYVSDFTLKRNLESGTPAIKYENEELFAVSERATYEEEFEFKTDSNVDPNKADGGEGNIFAITLKGKKSRSSQDWIEISKNEKENENVTKISPLGIGNNWHKAKLRFTVPDGVSLLRSFGITDLKGEWKELNIRKHRIRLLSDSITEAKYTDQVNLTTLVDHQKQLSAMLKELESKEQKEAELLKEKRELEDKIKPVDTAMLEAQKAKVTQLEEEKSQLEEKYKDAQKDPLNYFCEIKLPDNSRSDIVFKYLYAEPGGTNDRGAKVLIGLAKDKWEFIPNENGTYKIKLPDNYRPEVIHRYLHASTATNEWGNKVVTWSRGHDWEVTPVPNKNDQYNIELCDPDYPKKVKYAHLHAEAHFMISNLVTWKSGDPWELITTGEPSDNKKIDNAHKEWQRANQNYTIEENYLQRLQQSHNADTAQKEAWQKRLDAVNEERKGIKEQLDDLNKKFITGVSGPKQTAQTLPQVAEVKKLVTQGALLGFVEPASRLNAIETCEGNVQLSYFDTEGRMRQTNYDATADIKNETFEQWLPDANRVCLNFSEDKSVVWLKDAQDQPLLLPLNLDWSIEAWFVYPLPESPSTESPSTKSPPKKETVWHTLTGGKDRDCHIVVKNRNQLGIYLKEIPTGLTEKFCDSGYNLDLLTPGWHHLTAVGRGKTTLFYIDGQKVGDTKKQALADAERARDAIAEKKSDDYEKAAQKVENLDEAVLKVTNGIYAIGNIYDKEEFGKEQFGKLAEVRIWGIALSEEEIAVNSKTLLSGNEPGLLAYYPMNEADGNTVHDRTRNGYNGTASHASWWGCSAPIGKVENKCDALVCNEYSTVTIDRETDRKVAIMRRFLGYPTTDGVTLLPDKRVEKLELKWISNAQFAPTLLGYIEGAPPVPSENLTLGDDYNGATSVELTMSEDVAFSWNRGKDFGRGGNYETFIGGDTEANAGFGIMTKIGATRAGFKGNLNHSTQSLNETSITSSSSLLMTDKLELRGTPEQTAKFPNLGTRFIPKNVGYALVVSALSDVFVTRLARSGKMVGYQVQPVDGIPPDVNTITFLINPAYTMNGSLDGLTGSSPTSDRFFKHVPEMRSQYGSLYPASYYRLQEAYDLKKQIEAEDKRRESYFSNFNVRALNETSLFRNIDSGDAPTTIGVQREEDNLDSDMMEEENKEAKKEKSKKTKAEAKAAVENNRSATKQKQAEIKKRIKDQEKQVQATSSLADWQKRMEDIQIRANKRNIVNTYVWDADGGLRTEAQSFANTVEHTIGGSFTLDTAFGGEGKFKAFVAVELTSQATINLTQTMSKTESRSKGFQLNVELEELEHKGITDHDDKPILPGEKVDRYRFMSFYLEGSSQNFHDFFEYVVDPEWLHSNSEGARALRQAQAGKPNKAWRVLHRVTYIERPALMGFGRDVRKLRAAPAVSENQKLLEKIAKLEKANHNLEEKLDKILKQLEKLK